MVFSRVCKYSTSRRWRNPGSNRLSLIRVELQSRRFEIQLQWTLIEDSLFIHLYIRQTVCFVCFVCEGEILITVCHLVMFMVPLESSLRREVHPVDFVS